MKNLTICLLFSMLLFSCGDSVKEQNDDLLSDYTYAESLEADLAVPELMIAGLVQSIPSPVEMSSLIKATGLNSMRPY